MYHFSCFIQPNYPYLSALKKMDEFTVVFYQELKHSGIENCELENKSNDRKSC